jgi:hypothetical protein
VNARLDEALARKVAAVQRRSKKSLTFILRESLERYCDAELRTDQGSWAGLARAGFIGCADGPVDLSSGYKGELGRSLGRKA